MMAKIFFLIGMMMIVTAFIAIPVIVPESGLAFTVWMAGGMIMGGLAGMLEATEK